MIKRKSCPKCHYRNKFELRTCKRCNAHIHKRIDRDNYNPLENISIEKKWEILKPLFVKESTYNEETYTNQEKKQ